MSTNLLAQYAPFLKLARLHPRFNAWLTDIETAINHAQIERGAWIVQQFKKEYPDFSAAIDAVLNGTTEDVAARLKEYFNIEVKGQGLQAIAEIQKRIQFEIRKPRFARNGPQQLKG
jgi:hypothetical protein